MVYSVKCIYYPSKYYTSTSNYNLGDWIMFQKSINGICTGACFTFEILEKKDKGNVYEYLLG